MLLFPRGPRIKFGGKSVSIRRIWQSVGIEGGEETFRRLRRGCYRVNELDDCRRKEERAHTCRYSEVNHTTVCMSKKLKTKHISTVEVLYLFMSTDLEGIVANISLQTR